MYNDANLSAPAAYMPIESHRLHVFHAVAANGSIAEAARRMCLTRSALSHALRTLEDELGCDLFSRSEKRITLTAAGLRLLPHARAILDEMARARLSVAGGA